MSEPEWVFLGVYWPRGRWRVLFRRPCRQVGFRKWTTRGEAREYANLLQSEFPNVAVSLCGDDWYELREPADGNRGEWEVRRNPAFEAGGEHEQG